MQYINYNGNIYPEHEPVMPVTNRGFRYGDGFFESMVMFDKKIPLLEYHWSRIEFTIQVLSATLPRRFDIDRFYNMVLDLCAVNDVAKNARIRLQFFRKGKGLYLPEEDELGYVISMDRIENAQFEPGNGLVAGMRDDCFKPFYNISDLKTTSALIYVLFSQFAKADNLDEMIITDSNGMVCEAIRSNVFLWKDSRLITPDLISGCVNGVMRTYLMSTLGAEIEEREIESRELLEADEILLANAVKGVQWVREFSGKTYTNKKAVELTALLNKNLVVTR
jgi:branched-chain amino acid aminotransferase